MESMHILGFSAFSSFNVDPISIYNHKFTHHSTTIIFKKENNINYDSVKSLPVSRPIVQLKDIKYREPIINENINLFRNIITKLKQNNYSEINLAELLLNLHIISSPMYYPNGKPNLNAKYYTENYVTGDHNKLKLCLTKHFNIL